MFGSTNAQGNLCLSLRRFSCGHSQSQQTGRFQPVGIATSTGINCNTTFLHRAIYLRSRLSGHSIPIARASWSGLVQSIFSPPSRLSALRHPSDVSAPRRRAKNALHYLPITQFDEWCRQVMRSRIQPMKKIARSLRQRREPILNYFRAQKLLSSGVVEGLNNKARVTMRKSYGFRTFRCLELALYHLLGKLPEPESTHEFF